MLNVCDADFLAGDGDSDAIDAGADPAATATAATATATAATAATGAGSARRGVSSWRAAAAACRRRHPPPPPPAAAGLQGLVGDIAHWKRFMPWRRRCALHVRTAWPVAVFVIVTAPSPAAFR